ncbi:hypothetical protein LEP3755_66110 (plasmid) [Leptolyngbya sp. NIES-3755]|nr:hypothetical protein LEP3755_66110 [Leptolyngbya sp. NIES-3755]
MKHTKSHPNNLYAFLVIPASLMAIIWLVSGQDYLHKQGIQQQAKEQAEADATEAQTAEARLTSPRGCRQLLRDRPLSTGTKVYFSYLQNGRVVIDKNRPVPNGICVYDQFGATAIVRWDENGNPIATQLATIDSDRLDELLQKSKERKKQ